MNKLVFFIILCGIVLASSCKKDDDDGDGLTVIDTSIACADVTYSGQISSLITGNCATAGCHNGGSLGDYSTHAGLLAVATDGKMTSRVLTLQTMPPAGGLTSLELGQIKCWIDGGALDN